MWITTSCWQAGKASSPESEDAFGEVLRDAFTQAYAVLQHRTNGVELATSLAVIAADMDRTRAKPGPRSSKAEQGATIPITAATTPLMITQTLSEMRTNRTQSVTRQRLVELATNAGPTRTRSAKALLKNLEDAAVKAADTERLEAAIKILNQRSEATNAIQMVGYLKEEISGKEKADNRDTNAIAVMEFLKEEIERALVNGPPGTNWSGEFRDQLEARRDMAAARAQTHGEKAVENLDVLLNPAKFTPRVFIHGGYISLNPFSFTPNTNGTFTLNDSGSTSAGYVEFQYNKRWAWDWLEPGLAQIRSAQWMWPFSRPSDFDLQARLAYSFVDSDKDKISSIVSGGNLSAEITVGTPFLKYQNDWLRCSVDFEGTYGATSDRSDFDIHSTTIFGIGYHASVDSELFPGKILFSFRLGGGMVEIPEIIDSQNATVESDLRRPRFEQEWGTLATTGELLVPICTNTYIVAGGRLYANSDPNQWSAYVGLSQGADSLKKWLPSGLASKKAE